MRAFARPCLIPTFALLTRLEPVFWVAFLLAISGGLAFPLGTGVGEKLFWLAGDLLAVGLCALAPALYARHVFRNMHLFSWPFLAILSGLWSLAPGLSVYHGVQLAMTMLVGLVLRERFGLAGLAKLLWAALVVSLVLSILIGIANPPGSRMWHGEWRGTFSHKNTLGAAMVLLIYTSLALAWAGWRPILTLLAAGAAFPVLVLSWSGAAMITLAAVIATLPPVAAWRLGLRAVGMTAALAVSMAAAATMIFVVSGTDPYSFALDLLGKDQTLTGRTLLWEFGLEQFQRNPLLGVGYNAYWESAATSAAYLRYWIGQDLWSFHNNFVDVMVALGSIGLVAFVIGLVVSLYHAISRFLLSRGPVDAWALFFLVHVLVVSIAEEPLFYNHSLYQLLLVVAGVRLMLAQEHSGIHAERADEQGYGVTSARP